MHLCYALCISLCICMQEKNPLDGFCRVVVHSTGSTARWARSLRRGIPVYSTCSVSARLDPFLLGELGECTAKSCSLDGRGDSSAKFMSTRWARWLYGTIQTHSMNLVATRPAPCELDGRCANSEKCLSPRRARRLLREIPVRRTQ